MARTPKRTPEPSTPAKVMSTYSEYFEQNPFASISLEEYEALSAQDQAEYQNRAHAHRAETEHDALEQIKTRYGIAPEVAMRLISPAKVSSPWFLHPLEMQEVISHATFLLESDPNRVGAHDWNQAIQCAKLAQKSISAGVADGAVAMAVQAMQHVITAELLSGPIPMMQELRQRPRAAGKKAKGAPKPGREKPLTKALKILIQRGLTNEGVLAFLGNADEVDRMMRDEDFPIGTCDPETTIKEDGALEFFERGASPDRPQRIGLIPLQKNISAIRNRLSAKAA